MDGAEWNELVRRERAMRDPLVIRARNDELARERAEEQRRRAERPDRDSVLARDGYRCRYCGASAPSLAVDHIVPFSRGGSADPSNLAAACKSCNSRKGGRTPKEAGMVLLPTPAEAL